MNVGTSAELQEIVDRVRLWPADSRLELARGILSTIRQSRVPPQSTLRDLLGLIPVTGSAPDDADCRALVEDALLEKHGR
jgi:hypothetical protein